MTTNTYPIGTPLLYCGPRGQQIFGIIKGHEDRYSFVDWHGWVPPHLTGILSDVEISRFVTNLLILRTKLASSTHPSNH